MMRSHFLYQEKWRAKERSIGIKKKKVKEKSSIFHTLTWELWSLYPLCLDLLRGLGLSVIQWELAFLVNLHLSSLQRLLNCENQRDGKRCCGTRQHLEKLWEVKVGSEGRREMGRRQSRMYCRLSSLKGHRGQIPLLVTYTGSGQRRRERSGVTSQRKDVCRWCRRDGSDIGFAGSI